MAEKCEKEKQYLWVELEKEQKRWTVERENIETKAWVPLRGAEAKSIYCEQPREQVMPSMRETQFHFQCVKQHRYRPAYSLALPV